MKLSAVKRTPPVLSPLPLKETTSLSYVVKGTHDVHFLSSWTIQFKKAIKRRLAVLSDPIVAVMGSGIKTNKGVRQKQKTTHSVSRFAS